MPTTDLPESESESQTESTRTQPTVAYPVLPIPDGVIFPEMVVTVTMQSDEARRLLEDVGGDAKTTLLLVPKTDDKYAKVGVTATVVGRDRMPDSTPVVTLRAHHRAVVGSGVIGRTGGLWVEAEVVPDPTLSDSEPGEQTDRIRQLAIEYRALASTLLDRVGGRAAIGAIPKIDKPGPLADSIAYWPELTHEQKIKLLETVDIDARLLLATEWARTALAEVDVRRDIEGKVNEGLEDNQREAILRRQLAAIQSELGQGDGDAIDEYRAKLAELTVEGADHLPVATAEAIEREIDRLERIGNESMESNWIRTWLDTVFDIPWANSAAEHIELSAARTILDDDHTGLDEVKERLIEYLAVRQLKTARSDARRAAGEDDDPRPRGRRRGGAILALVGPPGVGKTSLGESVARSLGRSFVRLALGGVRDEAEIRGHRRTYVGARAGRLVNALVEAGSMNPVVLLDEIDKVSGGWNGDPSAALLEVLDPAQNHSFRDHYLEFELDLSDVVFIATANTLDTIPGPLLDRLEVIRLDGYTTAEKVTIARDHLLPRLIERNGLLPSELEIDDGAITTVAADYTREAGVRQLERQLDKIVRKAAVEISDKAGDAATTVDPVAEAVVVREDDLPRLLGKSIPREETVDRIDRPGIATGLAVTGAGGDVLFVETALVAGKGEPILTGQLGDVMKESASIVTSLVAVQLESEGGSIPEDRRIHVHFPAGAIPKDGPSAGITMTTALVSLLTGRRVRSDVAMTGEITLQGKVLPIGGVKQKVLAAHRAGITTVLLPIGNGRDLDDIPDDVRERIDIKLVENIDQVLDLALEPSTGN
ncbi:MAG: endopeptidase La [Acidimicrobiia bacterium]|nr:endopeptidase La [Acidimicrobiia bacterium]